MLGYVHGMRLCARKPRHLREVEGKKEIRTEGKKEFGKEKKIPVNF